MNSNKSLLPKAIALGNLVTNTHLNKKKNIREAKGIQRWTLLRKKIRMAAIKTVIVLLPFVPDNTPYNMTIQENYHHHCSGEKLRLKRLPTDGETVSSRD